MTVRDLMLVPEPSEETMVDRRTRAYIAQFAERTSPTGAIRRKCLECMGADLTHGRLPRGDAEAVRAVDECSATDCPLWAFRYGKNIWMEDKRNSHVETTDTTELKKAA